MSVKSVYSSESSVEEVVNDIYKQLEGINPKLVIYFASSNFSPEQISKLFKEKFKSCEVLGCTSSGEITSGKMLKGSGVAMALDSEVISDVKVSVLENISDRFNISDVMGEFEGYYGEPVSKMNFEEYVGIILIDGLRSAEERVMDKIGDITNVTFIGGSAGDDLKFEKTYVFANDKTYTDSAVLALIKPKSGFDIIKTQSFTELDK
jgi:hypothetical protein